MTAPALPGAAPDPFDAALAALAADGPLDAVRAAHRAEVERAVAERDEARESAAAAGRLLDEHRNGCVWMTWHKEAEDRAAALSARVARLEAALRFYADRDNWIYGEDMDGQTFAVEDCGEKARAALENPS